MSDQTTVSAPAPENTPVSGAPEGQPADQTATPQAAGVDGPTKKPVGRREAYRAMQERINQEAQPAPAADAARTEGQAEPVVDSTGRKHDPATGQFVAETGGDPNPPAASSGAEDNTANATAAAAARARIELPEALRQQGRDFIEVDPADEEIYRALTNGYTRTKAVEAAETRAREAEERALRLQAQEEARQKFAGDPDIRELDARIAALEGVDDLTADALRYRRETLLKQKGDGRFEELSREARAGEIRSAANRAETQAMEAVHQKFPGEWLRTPAANQAWQDATDVCVTRYQRALANGETPAFDPQEIVQEFNLRAVRDPWMRNYLTTRMQSEQQRTQEAERQRIAAEEQEAARKREAEMLQRTGIKRDTMHPMGRIASQVRTDRQSVSIEPDLSSVPAHDRKRAIKQTLFGPART